MFFPDNTFDMVYAVEATVHAQSLKDIYSEIFRVLKPDGVFGVYEWLMTEKYDNDKLHHREIRLGIEQGDGISNMDTIPVALKAMREAGFELEHHENLANCEDPAPWYWPLSGELKYINSIGDVFTILRMTHAVRSIMHKVLGTAEDWSYSSGHTENRG